MANINRTLLNLYKNRQMETALEAIERRDGLFNAASLIPNQAFPTHMNEEDKPACIYFSEEATNTLAQIKKIAHKVTAVREKNKKAATSLEFVCYGYRDHNDDFVIYEIECPMMEEYTDNKKGVIDIKKMATHTPDRGDRIESTHRMTHFVHTKTFSEDPIGRELVSMLGIIRPDDMTDEKKHTPTLKEIADIVLPGDLKFRAPFSTGLLIIPPADIVRTKDGYERVDASIECMILNHELTPSGNAKPTKISNITHCELMDEYGPLAYPISRNKQNLAGLPTLRVSRPNHTME